MVIVGVMLQDAEINFIQAFYATFGFFGGNFDFEKIDTPLLTIAALLAPIAVTSAVAFLFLETLHERWFFWREAKGHFIVVGLGNMGLTLVNDILADQEYPMQKKLVIIEIDKNNPQIEELKSKGVIVLIGDASSQSMLKKAKVCEASKVVCLTGNDLPNLEVAIQIAKLEAPSKPSLYVHLNNRENNELLKAKVFDGINIKSFSIYDNAAQTLFMQYPLGHNVDTINSQIPVKLAIVGFDAVGESLIYRALNLGHFYHEVPIEVTIFDEDYEKKQKEFEKRYPAVKTYQGKYWKMTFKDESELYTNGSLPYTQIIFCSKESENTYADAMRLMRHHTKQINDQNIEVYFFSDMYEEIASLIDKENNDAFKHLHAFGALKCMGSYDVIINEKLDTMARKSHESYTVLHGILLVKLKSLKWSIKKKRLTFMDYQFQFKELSKNSTTEWKTLGAFLQDSNRMQVEHLQIKLPIITHFLNKHETFGTYKTLKENAKVKWFHFGGEMAWDKIDGTSSLLEHVSFDVLDRLARIEHTRWNAFHILNGWSVLSPLGQERKDKQAKLHTCLVDWDKLDSVSAHFKYDYKSYDVETVIRAQHMTAFIDDKAMQECYMKKVITDFRNSLVKKGEKNAVG